MIIYKKYYINRNITIIYDLWTKQKFEIYIEKNKFGVLLLYIITIIIIHNRVLIITSMEFFCRIKNWFIYKNEIEFFIKYYS